MTAVRQTQQQTDDMINLMSSILSKKPLDAHDIISLSDAKKELSRIRKLMQNYNDAQEVQNARSVKRVVRNAIQEEDHIKDYVKKTIDKSPSVRKLIHDAIKPNVLFEMTTADELNEIIDIFEPCRYKEGEIVIQQGANGNEFFVVDSGELSITVAIAPPEEDGGLKGAFKKQHEVVNMVVGYLSEGTAFGELALIYDSPRAATIQAVTDCKLWRVNRFAYRGLLGQHRMKLHKEKVKFLSDVGVANKKFKDFFDRDQLDAIAQLMRQEFYNEGDVIIREGEEGATFYMISSGSVNIYKKAVGNEPIGTIGKKKYFGEKALLSDDVRAATCVAATSPLVCYVLARSDFTRVMGQLKDVFDGTADERKTGFSATVARKNKVKYQLDELTILNVLGQGAFGKVRVAKSKHSGKFYALKMQRKDYIIEHRQQDYVLYEYKLLMELSHPNIMTMHCAMQDSKYIYFLMDLLSGGELMDLLQMKAGFNEDWVRFYAASVVLAFSECHAQKVAYRDLKPENLVLDAKGYCVMVDFGLAKRCDDGPTYTFCGTPDYIAPEIIQGVGYGIQVDYWSLGVLMYELFEADAPFASYDPSSVAKKILQGRVDFSRRMSPVMQDIIRALLTRDPSRRLGCLKGGIEDVMRHRFYSGFDWERLLKGTLPPPYVPKLPKGGIEKLGSRDLFGDGAQAVNWVADLDLY